MNRSMVYWDSEAIRAEVIALIAATYDGPNSEILTLASRDLTTIEYCHVFASKRRVTAKDARWRRTAAVIRHPYF